MSENYEAELDDYIALIRENPRAPTPGHRVTYVAGTFVGGTLPSACGERDFNRVSLLTVGSRLERDMRDTVDTHLAQMRVRSRQQRSRRGSRRNSDKRVTFFPKVPPPKPDKAPPVVTPVDPAVIGPATHAFDKEKAVSLAQASEARMTVRQQLAGRRVDSSLAQVADEPATNSAEEGELESLLRKAYLEKFIESVKQHYLQTTRRRPDSAASDNDDVSSTDETETRLRVLRRLNRLDALFETRTAVREYMRVPRLRDVTDRPKKWVESHLVDAILRGAPSKLWRHVAALKLFPENAPTSVTGALKTTLHRIRGSSNVEGGWVARRIGELRSGASTEPLVITSVRLLLQARDRDATRDDITGADASEGSSQAHARCLRVLKSAGVSFEDEDSRGFCALHYAAEAGDAGVARYLVSELGLDVDLRNSKGQAALHVAMSTPDPTAAVLLACTLLELDADATIADVKRRTPLHAAAQRGLHVVAHMLLLAGSPLHAVDADGRTAVDLALGNSHVRCAEALRIYRSPLDDDLDTLGATTRMDIMQGFGIATRPRTPAFASWLPSLAAPGRIKARKTKRKRARRLNPYR